MRSYYQTHTTPIAIVIVMVCVIGNMSLIMPTLTILYWFRPIPISTVQGGRSVLIYQLWCTGFPKTNLAIYYIRSLFGIKDARIPPYTNHTTMFKKRPKCGMVCVYSVIRIFNAKQTVPAWQDEYNIIARFVLGKHRHHNW